MTDPTGTAPAADTDSVSLTAAQQARETLLEAEAIAQYLKTSDAANDENADVLVPALAETILSRIAPALKLLE